MKTDYDFINSNENNLLTKQPKKANIQIDDYDELYGLDTFDNDNEDIEQLIRIFK